MASMIGGIISLTLGVIVLASVFMTTVKTTNTTDWSSGEVALWGTLGLIGIAGLVYGTAAVFGLVG